MILRILSDQREILIRHVKSEKVSQYVPGEHLNRCGGGKPGTVRDVAVEQQIHAEGNLHALFPECPHNALWIICPVRFLCRNKILQRGLDHTEVFKIHGVKTQLIVGSLSCDAIGSDCQCAGKYMSAVVVGMLPDQIDTSGCEIHFCILAVPKYFFKLF